MTTYISWLSLQGLSHNTARLYVNAIGFQCKVKQVQDITRHFIIEKVLEGLKRSLTLRQPRLPITRNILQAILSVLPLVCSNLYESSLFSAAYCLAFSAFLRISELAVKNKKSVSDVLLISDIVLCKAEGTLTISVRHSKNDQYWKGSVLKIHKSGSLICAVTTLVTYLKRRPSVSGPLFCHLGGLPLTRYQFTSVLKKCLTNLNLDYGKFTSHSFRIGAATAAAMAGYSVESIKKAGRWRSEAYRLYVKPDLVCSLPTLT